MAQGRQAAMLHIGAQKSPLADVIMQLYLWSHTLSNRHWRKELRGILKLCIRNVDTCKGQLKQKDIIKSLDNIAVESVINKGYRSMLKDDEYASLKTERLGPPTSKQMQGLDPDSCKGLSIRIR